MAVLTYLQQLESVQAAIVAIESGAQSYEIAGRKLMRGDLAELYKREIVLRGKVERENNGGGIRFYGGTPC